MKKALLYLLLFSYTTIVLKPVFPTIADTVAHIFWYSEHMATVHYENGKYHVHNEYAQAAKSNTHEKDSSILKSSTDNEHVSNLFSFCFAAPPVKTTQFFDASSSFSCADCGSIYLPPRTF